MQTVFGSLTFRCMMCVAAYSCVMVLIFLMARMQSQHILSPVSVTIDTLAEQTGALENDRFDALSGMLSDASELVVYDGKGACLYSTSEDIGTLVPFSDLPIVASGIGDEVYYEVVETDGGDASADDILCEILLCERREENGTVHVLGRCRCDAELNIVDGDLFPGVKALTEEEFSLIRGRFGKNMQIGKYEYETSSGAQRTLVLASPIVGEKTYRALFAESDKVWYVALAMALVLTALFITVVFKLIRRSVRPLEDAIRARRDDKGRPLREDELPLELRTAYRSFVELMDVLDVAREENQTLIADVSHDLKTPLAVIGGYARAFEDGRVPECKREAYLHAMYEKAQLANQLLDALLAVARLNHPAFVANLVRCDLCEQVRLAAIASSAEVEQAGDVMEVDITENRLYAKLDTGLFSRVMGNLISNACKHNEAGTTICVSCHEEDGHALVSVSDDGVGFPDDLKVRAFEPFVTQNVARESGKGTGLGLTIAKKGVQAQGGRIYLRDNPCPPYASEVIIELPLCS